MFGIGGRFAGAKGMVRVPDLSNLTPAQAEVLLEEFGLKRGTTSAGSTSTSSLDNKVYGQHIAPNTLVDYETPINLNYYTYVAPAAPTPYPCGTAYWTLVPSDPYDCDLCGTNTSTPRYVYQLRQGYCLSGSPISQYDVLDTKIERDSLQCKQRDGICGYTKPVVTCTYAGKYSEWYGTCTSSCNQIYAWRDIDTCGNITPPLSQSAYSTTVSCPCPCPVTYTQVSYWESSVCSNGQRATATGYINSCTGLKEVVRSFTSC